MKIQSYIKYNRVSPKKLRFLAKDIKALPPQTALDRLYLMPERSAKVIYLAIKSAVASAKDRSISPEGLVFKELRIEQGPVYKRSRAGSRGMGKPYRRPTSHIKVILEGVLAEVKPLDSKKTTTIKKLPAPVKRATYRKKS